MLKRVFLLLLPFVLTTSAYPGRKGHPQVSAFIAKYPYLGNGAKVSRGPCPFLNTAANHGILPYNGTHVTLEQLGEALATIHLSSTVQSLLVKGVSGMMKKFGKEFDHDPSYINLEDLNKKGRVEHDLSLTRWDIRDAATQVPLDQRPSNELVESMIALAPTQGDHAGSLSYPELSLWRQERSRQEKDRHVVDFGIKAQILSAGECALALKVIGRDGTMPVSLARSFFKYERFPADWEPPQNIGLWELNGAIVKCGLEYWVPQSWLECMSGNMDENETSEESEDDDLLLI